MDVLSRTLLVTLTPPGRRNVGEVILADLCRFFPREKLAVCQVAPERTAEGGRETAFVRAPSGNSWRPLAGRAGGLCNAGYVRIRFASEVRRIVDDVCRVAREHAAEQIWLTLNSLPLVAAAGEIEQRTGLPLFTVVWDPPDWEARRNGWDYASRKWLGERFATVLRRARRVMVVSQEMAEEYHRAFQARCVIVRHALPGRMAAGEQETDEFRIGFAGTLYDNGQLNLLLQALNSSNWEICGRPVTLRMIGNFYRFNGLTGPARIELLGWRNPEETRELLAACHATYLPVPFQEHWADFARLSFPTKLGTYLAAGRPVFVHAPEYSSSVRFCRDNGFGLACTSQAPADILTGLIGVLSDVRQGNRLCAGVDAVLNRHFTPGVMRRQFAEFLGVDDQAFAGEGQMMAAEESVC